MISVWLSLVLLSLNVSVKSFENFGSFNEPIMDLLLSLSEFEKRNATSLCDAHLQEYLKGFKSKSEWALKMLDSTAKVRVGLLKGNTKFLGVYDECVGTQHPDKIFTGQYCLVMVRDGKNEIIKTLDKQGLINMSGVPQNIQGFLMTMFGVCVPSTCNTSDITSKLTNTLSALSLEGKAKISVKDKYCSTNELEALSKTDWTVLGVLIGFLVISVLSTIYDVVCGWRRRKPNILLASFSLVSNLKLLLSESTSADEIKPLHGIRTLAICWIVLGHSIVNPLRGATMNYLDSSEMIRNFNYIPPINAFFNVDTFFFLSGFLVYLSFRRSLMYKGSYDAPLAFIHRYIRLTPALAVVIIIHGTVFKYFGSGPLWNMTIDIVQKDCPDSLLYNLAYVQNIIKPATSCLGPSWYLSADMQLFSMAPLILFPLQFYPGLASVLIVFLVLASMLYSFIIVYLNDYGPSLAVATDLGGLFRYESVAAMSRLCPYVIGVALSYILFTMKDRKIQVKLSKFWVITCWLVAMGCFFGSLYGLAAFTDLKYTTLESAFYVPLSRLGSVIGVAWIVFACEQGYGGFINTFLSHKIFQPLGRLAYGVYLVHVPIEVYTLAVTRTNYYHDFPTLLYIYLGDIALSFILAVPLKLIFELPFGIIDKCLLSKASLLPLPRRKNVCKITEAISSAKMELGKVNSSFEND